MPLRRTDIFLFALNVLGAGLLGPVVPLCLSRQQWFAAALAFGALVVTQAAGGGAAADNKVLRAEIVALRAQLAAARVPSDDQAPGRG